MREVILATHNSGKAKEFAVLLADLPIRLSTLADYPDIEDIEENGATFEENALIKARTVAAHTGCAAVADDSGLEVDALDGAPGIYSARYAGVHGDDAANNRKLLAAMAGVVEADRGAQFRCAMAIVMPDGHEHVCEGIVRGMVGHALQGDGGFGYDPLFYLPDRQCTMAELSMTEKNAISHRGRASRAAVQVLQALLQEQPHA